MRINEIFNPNPRPHENVPGVEFTDSCDEALHRIADHVKKRCGPWLSQTHNGSKWVYRGVKHFDGINELVCFVKETRVDRQPMTTDSTRHQLFNEFIQHEGGVANRTNSLFCTSNIEEADSYGTPFVLIPIGKFNYTWSPVWEDWTIGATRWNLRNMWFPGVKEKYPDINFDYEDIKQLPILADLKNYDPEKISERILCDEGLEAAINKKHELMIKCDAAIYITPGKYRRIIPFL